MKKYFLFEVQIDSPKNFLNNILYIIIGSFPFGYWMIRMFADVSAPVIISHRHVIGEGGEKFWGCYIRSILDLNGTYAWGRCLGRLWMSPKYQLCPHFLSHCPSISLNNRLCLKCDPYTPAFPLHCLQSIPGL